MKKGKKNRSKVLHLPYVACIYNFNVAVRISINPYCVSIRLDMLIGYSKVFDISICYIMRLDL